MTGWIARCESRGDRPDWARHHTKCLRYKSSAGLRRAPARASRAKSCGGGAPGRSRHRSFCIAVAGRSRSFRRLRDGGRGCGGRSGGGNSSGGGRRSSGAAGRGSPGDCWRRGRCGGRLGRALVGTAWAVEGGLNAASHMMGWGAATGGGTDSDASRASRATDPLTLNGMQESGAVDHFQVQELRRQQRPQVFRIDFGGRAAGAAAATHRGPPGAAAESAASRSLPTATDPASARSPASTGDPSAPSRRSTS